MPPSKVLIIRHAEKPGDPAQDQPSDGSDLSTIGFARAAAIAYLIPARFGRIDYLFATAPSQHSNRPVETITPLSNDIKEGINANHRDVDIQPVADELLNESRYNGKTVLVCWHHGMIPLLATALGAANVPPRWQDNVFDRAWVITFQGDLRVFEDKPQCILFGDSGSHAESSDGSPASDAADAV